MPVYCFRDETGKIHTRVFPMKGEIPKAIDLGDGIVATRDLKAEHDGPQAAPGCWPMTSEAAGCHPSQVGEFTAAMSKLGVPTDFTRDGCAVFTDRDHRRKALGAMGLYDRSAGYGDPTPRNYKG